MRPPTRLDDGDYWLAWWKWHDAKLAAEALRAATADTPTPRCVATKNAGMSKTRKTLIHVGAFIALGAIYYYVMLPLNIAWIKWCAAQ